MVICLERGVDLHMAQLMPLPLTVSCFSKIQIGFTFLVPAHLGSPGQRAVKRCVCVCYQDMTAVNFKKLCKDYGSRYVRCDIVPYRTVYPNASEAEFLNKYVGTIYSLSLYKLTLY